MRQTVMRQTASRSATSSPRDTVLSADTAFADNLLLFIQLLRHAGLAVSTQQTLDVARALTLIDLGRRDHLYHVVRSLLVVRKEDLRLFDALFARFWSAPGAAAATPRPAPLAPRHDPRPRQRFDVVSYLASRAHPGDREIEVGDKTATWSATEVLQQKEFSAMSPEELAAVRKLIAEMRWQVSRRRTRRRIADRRGATIDLRRTLRATLRHGGVPPRLPRAERKVKERPIVLLADVSGSMEKYARLVLLFFYGVCQSQGRVESFVFGTRLTRLTPQLRLRNVDRALAEAGREVVDWAGGTRIGESLRAFNRGYSRRLLRRGAVVIVVSDGWERGDVALLRREMRYLHHRCHRLIWLNPLAGRGSYRPLVEGMAAALPFVDDFLPIHNLDSLGQLASLLAALPARQTSIPTHRPRLTNDVKRGAP